MKAAARSTTTRPHRARAPTLLDEDAGAEDEELAPLLAAPDPLALEPLSTAEIDALAAPGAPELDEQREGALDVLRKGSEAKLPIDPDAAASLIEANDAHLEVRERRPRVRRRRRR